MYQKVTKKADEKIQNTVSNRKHKYKLYRKYKMISRSSNIIITLNKLDVFELNDSN